MKFEFDADLDLAKVRTSYATDNRTRITSFLTNEAAAELSRSIERDVEFGQAFVLDGASRQAGREELASLTQQQQIQLRQQVFEQASRGVGYWYGRSAVTETSPEAVKSFVEWFNSDEILGVFRDITGISELKSVSAQVTRFQPGDFLTRHNDVVGKEQRRVAYAFNLSSSWHPDWGGLLQFFQQGGDPRDAWSPSFNTLSLFDVTHVHSVTSVTAFAPKARYGISGWLKTI